MPSKLEKDVANILDDAQNFIVKKLKEKKIDFKKSEFINCIYIKKGKRRFYIDLIFKEL